MVEEPLWWRRPLLREDEDEIRRATWLELFVDLMFVAIISACARGLALDLTLDGLGRFVVEFLPAWWIWIGLTVYNDRLDTDDVSHRLSFFVIMVALGGMAVSVREFFGPGFEVFAVSYVSARVVIIALWLRGGHHNPRLRPLTTRYAIGFSLAAAIWIAAIAASEPARIWLVLTALAIDFSTPLTTMTIQQDLPRLSRSHLPERFGLFFLIVLGEAVISVEQAVGGNYLRGSLAHLSAGPAALTLWFAIWWLYFDHVAENPPLPRPWLALLWSYPHLALAISLGVVAAGVQAYVGVPGASTATTMLAVGVGTGVSYAMVGLLEFISEPSFERRFPARSLGVHGGCALVAVALGLLGGVIDELWIFAGLIALAVLQIAYGLVTRARQIEWESDASHA
jgi:low temperature requirement protein LtrA